VGRIARCSALSDSTRRRACAALPEDYFESSTQYAKENTRRMGLGGGDTWPTPQRTRRILQRVKDREMEGKTGELQGENPGTRPGKKNEDGYRDGHQRRGP